MTITVLIVMHKMFVENKLIFHEMFCFDWSSYAFLSLSLSRKDKWTVCFQTYT